MENYYPLAYSFFVFHPISSDICGKPFCMDQLLPRVLIVFAVAIFLFLFYAGIVSLKEKEKRAAKRFFPLSVLLPLPYLLLRLISFDYQFEIGIALISLTIIPLLIFLIPAGNRKDYQQPIPSSRIDERDTMFSRNELHSGTKHFEE